VLACLIGYLSDFDLAEEATAEAFAIAAHRWPGTGMPDNPGAWLVTTARHRAIDRLRRDRVLAAKLPLLAPEPATAEPTAEEEGMTGPPIPDERLELVFMCCHPALAIEAQVALTLRAVAGLTTEEIARAFLVPAAALAIVDGLDLPGYQYWHSTRAELLRRLGRAGEARAAYREALALARTVPERRFLERRIAEI